MKTCGFCGWSYPNTETACVHVVRGRVTLLSPPHRPTKPLVPDIDGHDSASIMPWWARRWATRQIEPEESDSIRQARDRALADAIRTSGNPRIKDWGRHNDPVKGLPVGGVILDAQPDSAAAWAWMRQNGVAWDDSERKGAIPARRRSGADVGNSAGDDGLVDPGKLLHPRWRRHVAEPDAFLARWARQTAGRLDRVLVVGDEYIFNTRRHRDVRLRRPHAAKASRKSPRFSPTMLSDEARAKWELDNDLDYAMALGRRLLNLGTYAHGDQLEREGRDGGWARTVGAHQAGKLVARRRALERVEDDVDARLAGHHDAATAAKADLEKLIDTINDAAQRLPDRDIFDWIYWLLNAEDRQGNLGATESVLAWLADQHGIKIEVLRNVLAFHLHQVFREPLRPWTTGRNGRGAWTPPTLPTPRSVALDAFEALFTPRANGRPPDHNPELVTLALFLAVGIYHRLERGVGGDESAGLAAIEGCWREPWAPEGIALALNAAASAEIANRLATFEGGKPEAKPRFLSGAEVDEIVARVGYGRPGAVRALAFEIAALAYNLPRKALEATVKRTK